jgi:hypothetical protein
MELIATSWKTCMGIVTLSALTACDSIPGNNPIPEPKNGPVARVRVITPSAYGTNVNVRGYPGRDCAEGLSGGGNILNLAGVTALIGTRTGQTIGMPVSDKTGPDYKATEITVAGGQPFALSLEGWWGGEEYVVGLVKYKQPVQTCSRAVTFVPKAGADYEVLFSGTAGPDCAVVGSQLVGKTTGTAMAEHMEVVALAPTTLCKGLPTKTGFLPSPYDRPNGIPVAK